MTHYLERKKAEFNMAMGRFVLVKHHSVIKRALAALIIWLSQKRHGKSALDFLHNESTHDDHF